MTSTSPTPPSIPAFDVCIVGGGTAGITVAARLGQAAPTLSIAVIEPSETHYYQPLWTLVGGGEFDKQVTARPMAQCIPPGVTWLRTPAKAFEPDAHLVHTEQGPVRYEQLVVCPGIGLDWDAGEGLAETLGQHGVCSNYAFDTLDYTWRCIRELQRGRAVFSAPSGPVKCGGAQQKIMWIAEHRFRQRGVRSKVEVVYAIAGARIFGVAKYRRTLEQLVETRGIVERYEHELVRVDGPGRVATYRRPDGSTEDIEFDLLHVVPPQSAPAFVRQSPLANAEGWVACDRHTLVHPDYPDVFALGDASALPCAKTGASVRKQAPVLVHNLLAHRRGAPLDAQYHGYASCPIITEVGKVMLAEFDYDGQPVESFPFDQARPRHSMYLLKAYALPEIYWNGMLRGHM